MNKSLPVPFWKDFSFWAAVLVGVILFTQVVKFGLPGNVFTWDTWGYYLYLPQTFIEGDIAISDYSSIDHVVQIYNPNNSSYLYQIHKLENGNFINQYWCGVALLSTPFFFIGHFFAWLYNYPMDGYSWPYQLAFIMGNYAYMALGIIMFRKLLLELFTRRIAGLLILIICLGTNYFNIHLNGLGMTHIYLFTLYSSVLYFTIKWHSTFKFKYLLLCGLSIAVIILVRAVDGLIILIPLLWGVHSKATFKIQLEKFKRHAKEIGFIGLLVLGIICIQFVYFKITADTLFINSYSNPEESLYLDTPHISDFLFSWRKGWLIYTPIMFLFFVGLLFTWKNKRQNFVAILLFSLVFIYVAASWSTWWYGYSFSQRTMIQTYPILAIPIGILLHRLLRKKRSSALMTVLIVPLLFLNIFQTYQFKFGILHGSRMTFAAYFNIFGSLDRAVINDDLLLIDKDAAKFDSSRYVKRDYYLSDSKVPSILTAEDQYSCAINIPYYRTSEKYYAWYQVDFDYYFSETADASIPLLVCRFWEKNRCYGTQQFLIEKSEGFAKGGWGHATFNYLTPTIRNDDDRFECFVWGRHQEIKVNNLKMTAFVAKD